MAPKIKLYVLRHGSTIANEEGLYRGWLDYPLDDNGKTAAKRAGSFLSDRGIKRVICSPMLRAVETAKIVSAAIGTKGLRSDPRLRPLDVGGLSGKHKKDNPMAWYFDHRDVPVGGSGSSINAFNAEQREVFGDYLTRDADEYPILLVCHNSNVIGMKNFLERNIVPVDVDVVDPGGIIAVCSDFTFRRILGGSSASLSIS